MELKNILRMIDLFRGLGDSQLQKLVAISVQETYDDNDVIFNQGGPGDRMYIIGAGEVEVCVRDPEGNAKTTLYLGSGQVVGEMALLDSGNRSATVTAVQDGTEVYGIAAAAFSDLCAMDTALGFLMMRNLALDLSFKLRHQNLDPSGSV